MMINKVNLQKDVNLLSKNTFYKVTQSLKLKPSTLQGKSSLKISAH